MDDKEKSVIDKFKDTVAEVVGKMGCAMAPTAEEKDKEVAATTNEQVYVPEATAAPLFGAPARKRKARAKPKHPPRGAKAARKKTKASAKQKPAAKKHAKKVVKKAKSKR